jgi:hypothetical protein
MKDVFADDADSESMTGMDVSAANAEKKGFPDRTKPTNGADASAADAIWKTSVYRLNITIWTAIVDAAGAGVNITTLTTTVDAAGAGVHIIMMGIAIIANTQPQNP